MQFMELDEDLISDLILTYGCFVAGWIVWLIMQNQQAKQKVFHVRIELQKHTCILQNSRDQGLIRPKSCE